MCEFRIVTDLDECQEVWKRATPDATVWDLWGFRACFQRHFARPVRFVVGQGRAGIEGLLPLSWIEEAGGWGCFPGETWAGKTWLEQNRVLARDAEMLRGLLDRCGGPYHLRYLLPVEAAGESAAVDEVGYLFNPPAYGYDIENYFQEFSHKSAKRLKREIAALEGLGTSYRHDDLADFEHLVRLNVERFGTHSYFEDRRFAESFRAVMHYLHENGWLRMTAVVIGGEVAAVDMGCVYRGSYTLLGGGTSDRHPGVAKLINLHHMRRGCQERLELVDFLCGDFSWKRLFHLAPRPLYLLTSCPADSHCLESAAAGKAEHA